MVVLFPTTELKSTTGHDPYKIASHIQRMEDEYVPAKAYKPPLGVRFRNALWRAKRFLKLKRGGRIKRKRQRKRRKH